MNPMLKQAYSIGAQQAEQDFEKKALGYDYDYDSMNQGLLPPELMQLMQSPYGQAVQQGTEQGPQMKDQLATAMRGVGGGVTGAAGGAALGGALGYGGGHLANLLGADLDEDQIRKIMIYSALAGGGLGAGAGGVGAGGLLGQKEGSAGNPAIGQALRMLAERYGPGALAGAGMGGAVDEDDRLRGALLGALIGGPSGAAGRALTGGSAVGGALGGMAGGVGAGLLGRSM